MKERLHRWVVTFGAALLLTVGCRDDPRAGVDFPSPWPRPAFTLTGTDGTPVDFHEHTRGRPTLVLFGFASCPDVCPAHLASIAGAARQLPEADRRRLRVVFITADPERDTPDRLARWLRGFDSTFVGLSGNADALAAAAQTMLVAAPMRYADSAGRIVVVHYERVLGISADDSVRVLIPAGVGVEPWARELQRLVRIRSRRRVGSRGRGSHVRCAAARDCCPGTDGKPIARGRRREGPGAPVEPEPAASFDEERHLGAVLRDIA